jgi:hypothetical protein
MGSRDFSSLYFWTASNDPSSFGLCGFFYCFFFSLVRLTAGGMTRVSVFCCACVRVAKNFSFPPSISVRSFDFDLFHFNIIFLYIFWRGVGFWEEFKMGLPRK